MIFLKLNKKHFPKGKNSNKIFNKNRAIISSHNKNILNLIPNTEYGCNCRSKENCTLQTKCLIPKTVYQADVKNPTNHEKKF